MIGKIEILQYNESRYHVGHSCEEVKRFLCMMAYHYEIVIQSRKDSFNSLSKSLICPCWWHPVLLVQPVWNNKGNVCCFKQVQLDGSTQVALISQNCIVAIFPQHILNILQVVCAGCCHVVGVYAPCNTTQDTELIVVVVHILRCAVAPRRSMLYILSAPIASCILTNLYGLGVNAEHIFTSINDLDIILTDILSKRHTLFATQVVLTMGKVENGTWTLHHQPHEEVVLTVDTHCLSCNGEYHRLQIEDSGSTTAETHIPLLVCLTLCGLHPNIKNFSELCNAVSHIYDIVIRYLATTQVLK